MSYADQTELEQFFGARNIQKWADLDEDADPTKIAARIAAALLWATDEIDDRLRGGPYAIPFATPAPHTVVDICVKLAGCWLYSSRGAVDMNPTTGEQMDRLSPIRREARDGLSDILNGKVRLNITAYVRVPTVVENADFDDDEADITDVNNF